MWENGQIPLPLRSAPCTKSSGPRSTYLTRIRAYWGARVYTSINLVRRFDVRRVPVDRHNTLTPVFPRSNNNSTNLMASEERRLTYLHLGGGRKPRKIHTDQRSPTRVPAGFDSVWSTSSSSFEFSFHGSYVIGESKRDSRGRRLGDCVVGISES